MWHFENVPKIIHFYWGNEKMSFLRFLSIKSFRKYNPDWIIKVHIPKILGCKSPSWHSFEQKHSNVEVDFFDKLREYDVEIVEHDFETYSFRNDIHEVYKADFIRWHLLSTDGGVWSDADIIYIKSIEDLFENNIENKNIDTVLCTYKFGPHAIGFMMSSPNNILFKLILQIARSNLDLNNYQCIGNALLNKECPNNAILKNKMPMVNALFINDECVYSIDCNNIHKFYNEAIDIESMKNVIGFHWYAGHPSAQEYENKVTDDNYKDYQNTMKCIIDVALNT